LKAEKMIRAIGEIDDRYLLEAAETPSKKSSWKVAAVAAACFVAVISFGYGAVSLSGMFSAKSAGPGLAAANSAAMSEYATAKEDIFEAGGANVNGSVSDEEEADMLPAAAENEGYPEIAVQDEISEAPIANEPAASPSALSSAETQTSAELPGMSVMKLKSAEKADETRWKLILYDAQGELFEFEMERTAFAMPPEELQAGVMLEIRYGEGYEPVEILYHSAE